MKGYVMLINDLCMIIDVDASKRCIRLGKKPDYTDIIAPKTRPLIITPETIYGEDAMMNSLSKLKYAKDELMILRTSLTKDVITNRVSMYSCTYYTNFVGRTSIQCGIFVEISTHLWLMD